MSKRNAKPCAGFVLPSVLANTAPTASVLLAFSGGADSVVLLHLLAEAAKREEFTLTLAHINHSIRGAEALRDRAFCLQIAEQYGLELCVLDADVPMLAAQNGRGLEEEARAVRYAFFEKLMRERHIPLLATAHHADDNMETVLFRLCRGSGLRGMCGIAESRSFANGFLVRPLLQCSKREILTYCEENRLEYVFDGTNTDTDYARNRIRAEVIPVLSTLFEAPQARVLDMTASLREDEALLADLADHAYASAMAEKGLSLDALRQMAPSIRRRVLLRCVTEATGTMAERVHLHEMEQMLKEGTSLAQVALPKDHVAVCEFGSLRILSRHKMESKPFLVPFQSQTICLEASEIEILVKKFENGKKVHNLYTQTCIIGGDLSAIMESGLYWRSRRDGDEILQGGIHRRLCNCWNAAKVPPRMREQIPILCDREGIVWAPFVGYRDGFLNDKACWAAEVRFP